MKLKMLVFGFARDVIGSRSFDLDLPEHSTTLDLRQKLEAQYPALVGVLKYSFAVNQVHISEDVLLHENDEVAIIPPVSGG